MSLWAIKICIVEKDRVEWTTIKNITATLICSKNKTIYRREEARNKRKVLRNTQWDDGKEEPSTKNEKRESNNEKDLKERDNCKGMVVALIGRCGE
jgi:HD superfamily phosphodiesterase